MIVDILHIITEQGEKPGGLTYWSWTLDEEMHIEECELIKTPNNSHPIPVLKWEVQNIP